MRAVVLAMVALAGCDRLLGLATLAGVNDAHGSDALGLDGFPRADARDGASDAHPAPPSGALLHFTFDALNGGGADCESDTSGNGHMATCYDGSADAIFAATQGRVGSGALLVEGSAYLQTDSSSEFQPANALTVSLWALPTASESSCVASVPQTAVGAAWEICMSTPLHEITMNGQAQVPWAMTLTDATLGVNWHMFTLVWDGSTSTITAWEDAKQGSTTPASILFGSANGTAISIANADEAAFYTGQIDDMWVYGSALGSDDILALYEQ